jgi:hypothetical protein
MAEIGKSEGAGCLVPGAWCCAGCGVPGAWCCAECGVPGACVHGAPRTKR